MINLYIQIPYQPLRQYFITNICPYRVTVDDWREDDIALWMDRWIDWLTGQETVVGDENAYLCSRSAVAIGRLEAHGIKYLVIDEEGESQ